MGVLRNSEREHSRGLCITNIVLVEPQIDSWHHFTSGITTTPFLILCANFWSTCPSAPLSPPQSRTIAVSSFSFNSSPASTKNRFTVFFVAFATLLLLSQSTGVKLLPEVPPVVG